MKLDLTSKIVIFIMVLCLVIAIFYYFTIETNECASNPLVYGAKMYEDSMEGAVAVGKIYFLFEEPTKSPVIYFDSTNISILYE